MPRNWELALLMLRLSEAWVFRYAAWQNTKNAQAWQWTVNETGCCSNPSRTRRERSLAFLCSIAGMCMMYGGGVSVLFGIEPRLGGLAIAAFSFMGMRIHAIHRAEAWKAAQAGDPMGWSAYSAHTAAGLKNWGLAGAGLALTLVGTGPRDLSYLNLGIDFFGRITGLGP